MCSKVFDKDRVSFDGDLHDVDVANLRTYCFGRRAIVQ